MTQLPYPIREPHDYFKGRGSLSGIPTPGNILLFVRGEKTTLQQQALQNRSHHRWVLMFNLKTAGQVHVDHRSHTLHPGQALLVMPFQFHHFTHLESSRMEWLFCTFELEPTPLLDRLRHRVVDVGDEVLQARDRMLTLWNELETDPAPDPARSALLQATLLHLLLELRQCVNTLPPAVNTPPGNRLLETVNRLLDGDPSRSINHLAAHLNISESGLRARFRETAGVPLGQYLRNVRINRAMALLRTTDLPVSEVATESGFASPQAFSRAFKDATTQNPREYRGV